MKILNRSFVSHPALSLITLSLLATTSALAYEEKEGGGHNGPDLNGPSIPVQVDRLLTKEDMGKVISKCALQTLNEVSQQVFRASDIRIETNGILPRLPMVPPNGEQMVVAEGSFSYAVQIKSKAEKISVGANISNWAYSNTTKSSVPEFAISYGGDNAVTLESKNFPFVRFDAEYNDSVFDDLGRMDPKKIKVSKVRIYLPKELRIDEPLTNSMTKKPTSVTMNLRRYVDCIKSTIQN